MNKKLFVWLRHKPWSPFMFAYAKTVEEARQLITEELDAMYRMGYILDNDYRDNTLCLLGSPNTVFEESVGYVISTTD